MISADSLPNATLQRTYSSLTLGSRPLNVKVVGRLVTSMTRGWSSLPGGATGSE